MPHFFSSIFLSDVSKDIKTRYSVGLVDKEKHRILVQFWVSCIFWMIEKPWRVCPGHFSIFEESAVFDDIEVPKIEENRTDDIFSGDKMCRLTLAHTVLETLA